MKFWFSSLWQPLPQIFSNQFLFTSQLSPSFKCISSVTTSLHCHCCCSGVNHYCLCSDRWCKLVTHSPATVSATLPSTLNLASRVIQLKQNPSARNLTMASLLSQSKSNVSLKVSRLEELCPSSYASFCKLLPLVPSASATLPAFLQCSPTLSLKNALAFTSVDVFPFSMSVWLRNLFYLLTHMIPYTYDSFFWRPHTFFQISCAHTYIHIHSPTSSKPFMLHFPV